MIRWGLILAVVIIAAGAWFDWTYHAVRTEIHELHSRLASASQRPSADTQADCGRVHELHSNPIARMFMPHGLATLTEACDHIAAQGGAESNP